VPGHGGDGHASEIERAGGKGRIHCAEDPTRRGLSFAEVFAARRTGGVWLFGDCPLASRWFDRLSHEAGVLEPTPVHVAVPEACGGTVARVAQHIALYVGLRDAGGGLGTREPFAFAREFAMAYCGISNMGARRAMGALEKHGSIKRTGDVEVWGDRRAILWRLPK
jgi:hypothetical protein